MNKKKYEDILKKINLITGCSKVEAEKTFELSTMAYSI